MKTFDLFKHKKAILITLIFALILSTAGFFASSFSQVKADAQNGKTELYLPASDLEYQSLTSPIDVVHNKDVTAIVHNGSLLIYKDGEYKAPITNFTSIKQVKMLGNDTLLVSDNGSIYTIPLKNLSSKAPINDNSNNIIGGNYFDVNDKYLVSAYGTDGAIYRVASNSFVYVSKFSLDGDKPIAINSADKIFYVNDGIYTIDATATKPTPKKLSNAVPSKMIADNENVYYLVSGSNKVYQLSLSDNAVTELTATDEDYDLGNLKTPSGISFNGENLLITDNTLNAVQEFKITDGQIDFTGFAIAKDKTAYNRVQKSASDVERYGQTIAVLDDYKITVINEVNGEKYAKENYFNYILGKDVDASVQYFALGKEKLIYSTTSTVIKVMSLTDVNAEKVEVTLPVAGAIVDDITYQSGTFYLLIHTSTSSIVYAIAESDQTASVKELLRQTNSTNYGCIAVDVFKNLFVADSNGVYKYSLDKSLYKRTATTGITNATKLATDLGGKLYALTNGTIKVFDGSAIKDVTPIPLVNGDKIKTFALNFDKQEVSMLYENKEYISSVYSLENYSLDKATVSNNQFVTTGINANVDDLKFATVKSGNVYSVERKDLGFKFNDLCDAEEKYVYLCDVNFDSKLTLSALIGNNGLVLVNKVELNVVNATKQQAPQKVFITTDVNAYFYPIVTKNAEYSLKDTNVIRLSKRAEITPECMVNALDKDFYYATVKVDGKSYKGYVPVDFTTLILAEDYVWDSHNVVMVNKTTAYSDASMTTPLKELKDSEKVKVLSIENGVAKIELQIDGQIVEAYISADAIQNQPKKAIVNVIIIFAVTACLAGTALFFILRKKK